MLSPQPPALPQEFLLLGTPQPLSPSGTSYYWVAQAERTVTPRGRGVVIYGPSFSNGSQDLLFFQAEEALELLDWLTRHQTKVHALASHARQERMGGVR